MLKGVWLPLHISQLTETLLTDGTSVHEREWTASERAMRALAMKPANAHRDDCIRQWTPQENETLVAYMGGGLDLPYPPNFIKDF
ncbi:hypothetical protein GN244_ATG03581 [Phytophthora infestans]|uniref:Uncharacterized protein n=1 Tax=Phytophthora infestans TaxID=4787 RepID=A0A833TIW4_PHYIN|nr:hypothetical protein GN244_ATG03581 [Phytophthora infestans]KAF4139230.1 hypothetical protein GN958_ATG11590 [Phytophthora infestans]